MKREVLDHCRSCAQIAVPVQRSNGRAETYRHGTMPKMRVETLYRTPTPMKETSECFEIVIDLLPWTGPRNFRFIKKHGRWDEESSRHILTPIDIEAVEKGITLEQAEAMYAAAKSECARAGFVHSFAPDYSSDGSYVYELLAAT